MILDSLSNSASIEQLHPLFKKAFDFLKSTDFSTKEAGKIVLDGDDLYVSIAEPVGKSKDAAKMETHNKYIDIQMPLTTTETMGWKATKELKKITQPYNEEKDITFFADTPTTYIQVQPGEFAIFFPEDMLPVSLKETSKKLSLKYVYKYRNIETVSRINYVRIRT